MAIQKVIIPSLLRTRGRSTKLSWLLTALIALIVPAATVAQPVPDESRWGAQAAESTAKSAWGAPVRAATGTPAPRAAGFTAGPTGWVDISNRSAVVDLYNDIFLPSSSVPLGWNGNTGAGVAGTTSAAYKDAVQSQINYFRSMAGVPPVITLNSANNAKSQQAALMMSANGELQHNPPTTWLHYTADGAEAAANSNLCLRFDSDPNQPQTGCIKGYIEDAGAGNASVGHRRWILHPQTQVMATGDVPTVLPITTGFLFANATWVFDGNIFGPRPATREEYVAWPPPGFVPYQLVYPRWSFGLAGADFSTATVTMSGPSGNIAVTLEPVTNGFGENTLVWRPSDPLPITPPPTDTQLNVTINGVRVNGVTRNFSYSVTVFDPSGTQPGACSSFAVAPTTINVGAGAQSSNVTITAAPSTCGWTSTSNASWISVAGGTGSGNGTVTLNILANPNSNQRTGTVSVGTQIVTVIQAGGAAGPCPSLILAPTSFSFNAGANAGTIGVNAPNNTCTWNVVSSNQNWLVPSVTSGSGDGSVSFNVVANPTTSNRTATLTIGPSSVQVSQTGANASACPSLALGPNAFSFDRNANAATINVNAPNGTCTWSAATSASWITVTSGSSGAGDGDLVFGVSPNNGSQTRQGSIIINGINVPINQQGTSATICSSVALGPTSQNVPAAGATRTINITAPSANCTWSATSSASWLTITSSSQGTGSGSVTIVAAPHSGAANRTATITVNGFTSTVTQTAGSTLCSTVTLPQTARTISANAQTIDVAVNTSGNCSWAVAGIPNWVSLVSGSPGVGSGTFRLSVSANPTASTRVATLTIANRTFTLTQSGGAPGVPCTVLSMNHTALTIGAGGSQGVSISVTAQPGACAWTATDNVSWITMVGSGAGTGSGGFQFAVAPNPGSGSRVGEIRVGNAVLRITQSGSGGPTGCSTLNVNNSSLSIGSSGTSGTTISVTASPSNCSWTANSNAAWINIAGSGSGTGSGSFVFSVTTNTGPVRTGTITVGSRTITITQAAGSSVTCAMPGISAPTSSFDAAGKSNQLFTVNAPAGCTWSATDNAGWLSVQNGNNRTGTANASFTVQTNLTGNSRQAEIRVGNSKLIIKQAATTSLFADISPAHFAFDAANRLFSTGVTTGCATNPRRYCPNAFVTRAQMAVFLIRAVYGNDNFPYPSQPYFVDVPASHRFFKWIQKMRQLGFTSGCAVGRYCPGSSVTREQMAVFIVRLRYGPNTQFAHPAAASFTDVPASNPFFRWIQKLKQTGVTSGCGVGVYCPKSKVTRGQMALFLMRAGFSEFLPNGTPIVMAATVTQNGNSVQVIVNGLNTNFGNGTSVSAGPGVTVNSVNVTSSTGLMVMLTIQNGAASGPRPIILTTGGQEAVYPNAFFVP